MKRKVCSILFALVLAVSLVLVPAAPAAADGLGAISPTFTYVTGGTGTAACSDEQPNSGLWSAKMTTTTTNDRGMVRFEFGEDELKLDDLTTLGYWEYVSARDNPLDVFIDIWLDFNDDGVADTNDYPGYMQAEPYYTVGAAPMNTWTEIDAMNLMWSTLVGPDDPYHAPTIPEFQANWHEPCAHDYDMADWTDGVDFGPLSILRIDIRVGYGSTWTNFTGYADDIVINDYTQGFEPPTEVWVDDDYTTATPGWGYDHFATIQDGIDAVAGSTVNVAEGTYDEQVVIDKELTLQGAGDTTVIQPAGPELTATASIPWIGSTKPMSAIVSVETTGDEVIIRDLKIDGSQINSKSTLWVGGLVYLETKGKVEGVTVTGNPELPDRTAGIFAAAISHSSTVEVTGCNVIGYNRAGIYALGAEFTADYHHNEINGPGSISTGVPNGMFFLEGAKGSATYNTVTDLFYTGETYRSTGIGTYNAGTGITFGHNTISNVQNAFALSTGTSGTIVEYNNIFNNHTGVRIEAGATNSIIQYNNIHGNDFAIRCGPEMGDSNEVHYNNFVDNPGLEWINVGEGCTYVGAVCNLHETYTLDATNNWWGHASGPGGTCGRINSSGKCVGKGDCIEGLVIFDPWLRNQIEKLKEPKK